ncbi:MAG: thioredoxin-disulfide reductase [Clostridiales bacterium]|nr:thioredoxin-disulfide reductase [Clostridiales bacterium]
MEKIYDVIVIGSGPAGITAAIYGERAGLSTLVVEGSFVQGGQILNTYEVDNYPGLPGISGMELAEKMKEHMTAQGTEIVRGKVNGITLEEGVKVVHTKKADFRGKTVILAAGAVHRKLQVPGEEELSGMGVSYCATCDGAFFKDKTVAVVGGGDVAVEDAIFLARGCKKVYLIHRRDELRAAKSLQEALGRMPQVEMCWNQVVTEIGGENQVQWIQVEEVNTKESRKMEVDGVFIAVGITPDTEFVKDLVELDAYGYIAAGEDGKTNVPGIFAAGDIRTKPLRQIITAAADGANCVASAEEYLRTI